MEKQTKGKLQPMCKYCAATYAQFGSEPDCNNCNKQIREVLVKPIDKLGKRTFPKRDAA